MANMVTHQKMEFLFKYERHAKMFENEMGLKYLYYMVVVHIQTSQKGRPEDVQMTAKKTKQQAVRSLSESCIEDLSSNSIIMVKKRLFEKNED